MAHASADDPPAVLLFTRAEKAPVKGEPQADPTHSPVLGLMLQARLDGLEVPCEVRHPLDGRESVTLTERILQSFASQSP